MKMYVAKVNEKIVGVIGYRDEGIRRKRFVSKATGKMEDEYITGLLKDEWIH